MENVICDWCGRPACFATYRTIYEETEYETTSFYNECEHCHPLRTKVLVGRYTIVHLPNGRKRFVVETSWLDRWRHKNMKGGDLHLPLWSSRFVSIFAPIIYKVANKKGKIISEWEPPLKTE